MRRFHIILILLGLVWNMACTRKSDVVLPPHTPTLVLHSYMNVGDVFSAYLGKTIPMDAWVGDSATFIKDGWMKLYENGVLIDSLIYDPPSSTYRATFAVAQLGKNYKLVAGAPGFTEVEATAKAPLPVTTIGMNHLRNARNDVSGNPLDDITFSFIDPSTEKNFYLAALYPAFPGMYYLCVYTYDPSVEKYTEGLLPFDNNSCIGNQEILFTDKSFNGQLKQITLSSDSYSLQSYVDPMTGNLMKPFLKRYSINEDYYKYFKQTYTLYLNSGGPTLSDPVIIKGNVTTGYGLFTIYTSITDSLP